MRQLLIFAIVILINSCSGYNPVFSSKEINFYIEEIKITDDNKLIRNLVKNLKPYTINNNKKKLLLELNLEIKEKVTLRDEKGDVSQEKIEIILKVKSILPDNNTKNFEFVETFVFNNQSNKFELNQYKKSIQTTLIDQIYQDLILKLRTL
jgi:hypothetical protein|tara:strand:- start:4805 stop:5257 length:453 start_codon:yes stop_codon:yes gene_type:complete